MVTYASKSPSPARKKGTGSQDFPRGDSLTSDRPSIPPTRQAEGKYVNVILEECNLMKSRVFPALIVTFLLLGSSQAALATLIPTEDLEQYFIDNNVEYFTVPDFQGDGGQAIDYLFIPTRDPADNETIGVFFELETGNALSDLNMHWAIGLRGPHSGSPSNIYGGRGLALGNDLSNDPIDRCLSGGGFIEDFTASEAGGEQKVTYCQTEPISNNNTLRVDIHVSKNNVLVRIWKKQYLSVNIPVYTKIADYSCMDLSGPGRLPGICPEDPADNGYGGVFIGSAALNAGYLWDATNIHVAFF